jgi:hypothetical protein
MRIRKNVVEYGIHILVDQANLLQEDSLSLINIPSTVYMICKRRRICLVPDRIQKNTYNFAVKHGDDYCKIDGSLLISEEHAVNIEYPFTKFHITNNLTGEVCDGKCGTLLSKIFKNYGCFDECNSYYHERICHTCDMHGACYDKCLDLEVLYVGQSHDSNKRLSGAHKTLQKINLETMINEPDHEIWIVLLSDFRVKLHTTIADGMNDNFNAPIVNPLFVSKMEKKEITNLVEAGLINYFKPIYNEIYKYSFPNKNHKSYPFAYKNNINALSLELNTSYIVSRTCSSEVSASTLHIPIFKLFDKQYKHLYEF